MNGPLQQAGGGQMPVMGGEDNGTIGGDLPGSEQASAEEQGNFDKVVTAGLEVIFGDDKTHEALVKQLEAGADNPSGVIAQAATNIMGMLDDQSKGTIPVEVIIPAAAEIMVNIGELANATGAFQVDEGTINRALHGVLAELAQEYDLSPEEVAPEIESLAPEILDQIKQSQESYYNG